MGFKAVEIENFLMKILMIYRKFFLEIGLGSVMVQNFSNQKRVKINKLFRIGAHPARKNKTLRDKICSSH